MKQIKKWRYYCDFCKKVGGSKYHMEKHERGCTANPDRVCGMCKAVGNEQAEYYVLRLIIQHYKARINSLDATKIKDAMSAQKECIDLLREQTNNCPACILSAIRNSGLICSDDNLFFDFEAEKQDFWLRHEKLQEEQCDLGSLGIFG